ncbi:MAG: acyltransferase [Acidobacteriota bacterium]|nr:acyltransferase [Acidobacteriota bacterium]
MHEPGRQPEIGYRPDVDGLRGIAILGVVADHAGLPFVPGGFTGVDIFFVISGYLITRLLLKEAHSEGTISIANFYARRVRRLLPALATVIAATLVLGFLFLPPFGEKQALAKSAVASVFFAANHYFLTATGGYFHQQSELMPLLHLWSLAVEEQFYLVWPLLLITVVKLSPPAARTARIRMLIVTLLAASFIASSWLLRTNPTAAFFVLPSRAWELGVGSLLASIPARSGIFARAGLGRAAGVAGAVLIGVAFFLFHSTTLFPGPAALVPVIGSVLLIFSGLAAPRNPASRILASKPMVTIGLLSYSWYLWHWPLLSIVRNRRFSEPNLWIDCGIALFSLLCAAVTVRYVENPIRHHRGAKVGRKTVLLGGAATLAALLGTAGALGAIEKFQPPSRYSGMLMREQPPLFSDCMIANQTWDGRVFLPKCDEVPPGAGADGPLVVVWGDSHADAWAPAIRVLGETDRVEVREISLATCPPVSGAPISTSAGLVPNCRAFNAAVLSGLKQLREANPKRKIGLVLAGRWPGYLGSFPIPMRDRGMPFPKFFNERGSGLAANLQALNQGLKLSLAGLQPLHIRALVLLGGPEFRIAPWRCAGVFGESACSQLRSDNEAYRKPAVDTIRQAAAGFPGVRVVDPLPFFCQGVSCPGFIDGNPVVYDDNHISVSGGQKFAPAMRGDFRWLFAEN